MVQSGASSSIAFLCRTGTKPESITFAIINTSAEITFLSWVNHPCKNGGIQIDGIPSLVDALTISRLSVETAMHVAPNPFTHKKSDGSPISPPKLFQPSLFPSRDLLDTFTEFITSLAAYFKSSMLIKPRKCYLGTNLRMLSSTHQEKQRHRQYRSISPHKSNQDTSSQQWMPILNNTQWSRQRAIKTGRKWREFGIQQWVAGLVEHGTLFLVGCCFRSNATTCSPLAETNYLLHHPHAQWI